MKDEEVFSFAGIWDTWNEIVTCSIITTEPNQLMDKIHIRMPVILDREDEKEYLGCSTEDAQKMLKSYDAEKMKMYQVSKLVNSPANDSAEVIKPVTVSKGLSEFIS